MPPSRRRPPATPTSGRRPRVAGLRPADAPRKPEPDETPTQTISAVPADPEAQDAPRARGARPAENVTTTAGAEESLSQRRARRTQERTAKATPVEEPETAEEPEETKSVDSGRGVPSWFSSAGKGVTDGTKIAVLACAAVVLAAFGVFAGLQWWSTINDANTLNTAYVDVATTSQVKGEVIDAIQKVFSYTYANPNQTKQDAQNVLTGSALCQYNFLFKNVLAQAPAQQTTVTTSIDQSNSGVELLQGDQARLLLMINQETTRASTGQKVTAQAVLEVGAIQQNGTWKVDNLSTFGTGANGSGCK